MLIPKNRHEYYLAVISGNDYPTFPPKIREEMYLAKLVGREVDVPIPKTPKERAYYNIINDIKFEPENRWQTFVAAANDDSITAPIPRTREEMWWANISLSHEVIVEYVGTLPATLRTAEGYLEQYKIYGNTVQDGTPTPENPIVSSRCGVRTENLFDKDSAIPNKQYDRNGNLTDPTEVGTWYASGLIEVEPNKTYVRSKAGETIGNVVNFYASDKTFQSRNTPGAGIPFTIPSTTKYISFAINADNNPIEQFMLTESSTAPTEYIPYGYKLPLTSGNTSVDIYIGDATISAEEYVDSSTGKIYRMVGSTLTPVDPPIPFPQIPTIEDTTIIDYNGEPKPDKVELTYKTIKRNYISADDKVYQDPNGQLLGG